MFAKDSRYRNLPETVVEDARGRTAAAKALRPLPPTDGTFEHTIEDAERLDNLAFKYYRRPERWWRICDANPEFLSPLDLVGRKAVRTVRLPLRTSGPAVPDWAGIAQRLAAAPGVSGYRFVDDVQIRPERQTIGGQPVVVNVERHEFAVLVTHNERVLDVASVSALLAGTGITVGTPQPVEQAGRRITVPPDTVA